MRTIKANLPEGVKKQFGHIRGVKTRFVSKSATKKNKTNRNVYLFSWAFISLTDSDTVSLLRFFTVLLVVFFFVAI